MDYKVPTHAEIDIYFSVNSISKWQLFNAYINFKLEDGRVHTASELFRTFCGSLVCIESGSYFKFVTEYVKKLKMATKSLRAQVSKSKALDDITNAIIRKRKRDSDGNDNDDDNDDDGHINSGTFNNKQKTNEESSSFKNQRSGDGNVYELKSDFRLICDADQDEILFGKIKPPKVKNHKFVANQALAKLANLMKDALDLGIHDETYGVLINGNRIEFWRITLNYDGLYQFMSLVEMMFPTEVAEFIVILSVMERCYELKLVLETEQRSMRKASIRKDIQARLAELKGVALNTIPYPRSNAILIQYQEEIRNLENKANYYQEIDSIDKLANWLAGLKKEDPVRHANESITWFSKRKPELASQKLNKYGKEYWKLSPDANKPHISSEYAKKVQDLMNNKEDYIIGIVNNWEMGRMELRIPNDNNSTIIGSKEE
ncbi:hypothetical protein Glove_21g14 [Diversispora epigaea]|uniref:Uncharacterized protein n=1 Tax=Diversispora epigaea TaxID=1348612 RepID=A0A397JJU6_9GLOM|nr:hypothetical protein Glove_21g14 [Diversispora epigaea]